MNHFIKLPGGAIVNVAHVRSVKSRGFGENEEVDIDTGVEYLLTCPDIGGAIYAYFDSIAQEIPGDDGH